MNESESCVNKRYILQATKHMNTYRLESKHPFSVDRVNKLIQTLLDKELENVKYEPTHCAKLCMNLSAELKSKVKEMGFDR